MKFEKLNDNKIKILINIKDLERKHIDFHSFMSNSIESQELFIYILQEAEKKIGFITNNYNIHIEAFATSDGNFIFTITRISRNDIYKKKKLIYKRKLPKSNRELIIYCFNTFDNYCDFCNFLDSTSACYLGSSCLVKYNSKYYLLLNNIKMNSINSKNFFTYLSEFSTLYSTSTIVANILLEHGEQLIPEKAIEIGINYLK